MARTTIDDCLKRIPNRFDMTLAASMRARQITRGIAPMVEPDRDKATVIALRELAAGKYGIEILAANRTDARNIPTGVTATENAWNRITETGNEPALDDSGEKVAVVEYV